jgi:hypothetical protein
VRIEGSSVHYQWLYGNFRRAVCLAYNFGV